MNIGELVYSLGAEWDKESLENIKDGFDMVAKSVLSSIAVISASMAGTFAITKEIAEINDELGKMARNRDIAVSSLQALEYSFKGAGLEGSKVNDVLKKLQDQKEKFKTGKADYEAFDRIGINPNAYSNTENYFNAVIDGLKNIKDEATKADLSNRLLGSSDMKNLIDGGSEAIKKQKAELKELGILINNQDYKQSAEFNDTLLKTMTILKGLANKVMTSIMPIFSKLMKQFNDFMRANKELLTSGLSTFFNAIIDSSKFFISLIGRIIEHLGGLKIVISVIAGLLMIWQLPLIATIALIAGLALVFDDVMSFFKGNDSVIGGWLQYMKDSFSSFKNWLGSLFDDINIFESLGNQIDDIKKSIFAIFPDIPSFKNTSFFMDSSAQTSSVPASQSSHSQTTNTYHINAQVDARNKMVGDAIEEIIPSQGY